MLDRALTLDTSRDMHTSSVRFAADHLAIDIDFVSTLSSALVVFWCPGDCNIPAILCAHRPWLNVTAESLC